MCGADTVPAAGQNVPPVTLDDVKRQLHTIVGEIHTLYEYARELEDNDVELPFDLYDVEDLSDSAEELSNAADGIE